MLREYQRLIALELEEIGYGAPPIQPDQWRNFAGMHVVAAIDQAPGQARRLRNVTELAALAIPRSNSAAGAPFFLGMDLRRWRPEIGAKVVAYGFADLDVGEADADADVARPISQYLYGSAVLITDIEPEDRSRGRPWPFFRVDRDWPGGMSGGPVVNAGGHVVGVVSTGMTFAASGSAVFFAGSGIAEGTFPQIDAGAPEHVFCWAGIDERDRVIAVAPTREALVSMSGSDTFLSIRLISFNASTGDWMSSEGQPVAPA